MNGNNFNEERTWIELVESQIGYEFKNKDLLRQAFIRKSYSMENGGENNEVLEFVGDRTLDVTVTKRLMYYNGFMASEFDDVTDEDGVCYKCEYDEYCSNYPEGKLTEIKSQLVRKENLAARINEMDLAQYLIMGKGDIRNKVDREDSVKEDLFEAIIGAVTIDSDWDFKAIEDVVEVMLNPDLVFLEDIHQDNYVKMIQDWLADCYDEIPEFIYEKKKYEPGVRNSIEYMSMLGDPKIIRLKEKDEPWSRLKDLQFECQMKLVDGLPIFSAFGKSKSEARKKVCELAYEYLEEHDLIKTIKDEIEYPNRAEAISQLEILARRGYISMPEYEYIEQHDEDGNPIWKVECYVEEVDLYFYDEASSKKAAKKGAAYGMLMYLLGEDDE